MRHAQILGQQVKSLKVYDMYEMSNRMIYKSKFFIIYKTYNSEVEINSSFKSFLQIIQNKYLTHH